MITWKQAGIVAAIIGMCLLFNSCSCDHWFNNGYCALEDTWLGSFGL